MNRRSKKEMKRQKDIIKKIVVGLLVMPICSVLAILLWEYIKQYLYINYENTNKIGRSIVISTIVVEVIYIYWCFKSSKKRIIGNDHSIIFILFSIGSTITIMISINFLVLSDVWVGIIIEGICTMIALFVTYIIANNL